MDLESEAKEYKVSVRTNDIHEAIAKTGTALAALVDEALLSHEPHEIDEECEFEELPGTCCAYLPRTRTRWHLRKKPIRTYSSFIRLLLHIPI